MSNFGYPATDPIRAFERQDCRQIESEAARLSDQEGRAVDQFGFAARRALDTESAAEPAVKDGQRRRKERLQIARWSNQARDERNARHERLNRELCEAFDVPSELSVLTVQELFANS